MGKAFAKEKFASVQNMFILTSRPIIIKVIAMLHVNDYFKGKVKSIDFENGSIGKGTIGALEAGEYNFSTSRAEEITIISGAMKVLLPGATAWIEFVRGEHFQIPAYSEFTVQSPENTAFFCKYLS